MIIVSKITQKTTIDEFIRLPETKPASEYLDGEIGQKPMPQGEHSKLQNELLSVINQVGKTQKLAYAFPELRCTFDGISIVPDIAVFLWERIPKTPTGRVANKFEIPPDWMIEILSPEQSTTRVIKKILFCLAQGTQLAWLVDCDDESVTIFYPDKPPVIKEGEAMLPGLDVLSDWQLSATELFNYLQL